MTVPITTNNVVENMSRRWSVDVLRIASANAIAPLRPGDDTAFIKNIQMAMLFNICEYLSVQYNTMYNTNTLKI